MNCENALELMNRELDEALTAEESAALRAHLDACPDCRETWRQLHELDALLQECRILGQGWCLTVLAVQPFHLLLG